jgi:hypothetical protein
VVEYKGLFSQLEDRVGTFGHAGYHLLESLILETLEAEAKSQGKAFEVQGGGSHKGADALAPDGIGDLEGPLAIEIVSTLSPKRIEADILRHRLRRRDEAERLLIIGMRADSSEARFLKNYAALGKNRVVIWGRDEIQQLLDRHPQLVEKVSSKLFSFHIERVISTSKDDWRVTRESILSDVRQQYRSSRFSLFLGAGVSSSAGLPDWNALLDSLLVSMLADGSREGKSTDAETSSIVKRLREVDGPSALILARYIRKGLSASSKQEQSDFVGKVTDRLYSLRDKRFSLDSALIKEIVSLCAPSRTGAKVKAVITYNFDDLIERELSARGVGHRSIFEDIDLAGPEELPIYHVHGFLPENRSVHPNIERSTLVFSEEGYHQIYRDSYHWSNLIQLNNLKEVSCLMVGLSLVDPNLRRLLEISAKYSERPKHFAFLRRISYEQFSAGDGGPQVRASGAAIRGFLERHHKLNEEVMRELGVNVIWYDSYDEIPRILAGIRQEK